MKQMSSSAGPSDHFSKREISIPFRSLLLKDLVWHQDKAWGHFRRLLFPYQRKKFDAVMRKSRMTFERKFIQELKATTRELEAKIEAVSEAVSEEIRDLRGWQSKIEARDLHNRIKGYDKRIDIIQGQRRLIILGRTRDSKATIPNVVKKGYLDAHGGGRIHDKFQYLQDHEEEIRSVLVSLDPTLQECAIEELQRIM